jgi:uncharacterized protein
MNGPDSAGVTAAALEEFLRADYASKDTMHDTTHIRRVHRAAERLALDTGTVYDRFVLLAGAYLHGVVYIPEREREARAFLERAGVQSGVIDRAVTAARESQTDAVPRTREGMLLHDGHLLEGGRSFLLVKTLVTGAARGSALADIVAFWDHHVVGRFRCALPLAQQRYNEQEAFAQAVFAELARDPGLDTIAPAA